MLLMITLIPLGCNEQIPDQSGLVLQSESSNFGTMWDQSTASWSLEIYNHSDMPVSIEDIRGGCRCVSIDTQVVEIQPRSAGKIDLVFDFGSQIQTKKQQERDLRLLISCRVRTERKTVPKVWKIGGTVKQVLSSDAESVQLVINPAFLHDQPEDQVISIESELPLKGINALIDHPAFLIASKLINDKAASITVKINTEWCKENGDFSDINTIDETITITATPKESRTSGTISNYLPVTLRAVRDVYAVPKRLSLGPKLPHQGKDKSVVLLSHSKRLFNVDDIVSTSDHIQVREEFTPQGSRYYKISLLKSYLEQRSHSLYFKIQESSGDPYRVRVPVTVLSDEGEHKP